MPQQTQKQQRIELSKVIDDLHNMINKLTTINTNDDDAIKNLIQELMDHYTELNDYKDEEENKNKDEELRNIALRQMYGLPIDPKVKFV